MTKEDYKELLNSMIDSVEDLKFLNQLFTILKKHLEKKGKY